MSSFSKGPFHLHDKKLPIFSLHFFIYISFALKHIYTSCYVSFCLVLNWTVSDIFKTQLLSGRSFLDQLRIHLKACFFLIGVSSNLDAYWFMCLLTCQQSCTGSKLYILLSLTVKLRKRKILYATLIPKNSRCICYAYNKKIDIHFN